MLVVNAPGTSMVIRQIRLPLAKVSHKPLLDNEIFKGISMPNLQGISFCWSVIASSACIGARSIDGTVTVGMFLDKEVWFQLIGVPPWLICPKQLKDTAITNSNRYIFFIL